MKEIRITKEQRGKIPILIPVMSGAENDTLKSRAVLSLSSKRYYCQEIFLLTLCTHNFAAHLFPL